MQRRHDAWRPWWARLASLTCFVVFLLLLGSLSLRADAWDDRTTLRFSSPVMVPGATLPAGEYVFQLMDLKASRHLVEIRRTSDRQVVTVTHAIPVKRRDPEGTTTLTFSPTAAGSPPALKAWYYPGSIYGHEFIYSADEARRIAERDRTIVLSEDRGAGDAAGGSLRLYQADGSQTAWRADDAVIREWTTWSRDAMTRARTATDAARGEEQREATAPMVDGAGDAMRVSVDELEESPRQYTGKRISVDAEVEKVLGPRLFTIDEPSWADLDGEILVHVPTALAAVVRPDDRVTITGTVRAFADAHLDDEWRWVDQTMNVTERWGTRPVLVASRVSGGDDDRALLITRERRGTTSAASATPIGRLDTVTAAAVGRTVELDGLTVEQLVPGRGLFVSAGDRTLFVRPADGRVPQVERGSRISVDGFVLTLPPGVKDDVFGAGGSGARVYVFATDIS